MSNRNQRESLLLGVVAGAVASLLLVVPVSLLPVFDGDAAAATNSQTAPTTAPADAQNNAAPGTQPGGGNAQVGGSGQGGGPPEGRGPGSANSVVENPDPLSYGLASPEVSSVFNSAGCVACHSIKGVGGGSANIGPHLFRVGAIAVDRRPGSSVVAYIEESIMDPGAFTVPNCPTGPCPEGLMPQTYAETLSESDISTIVNYLAALGTAAEADVLSPPSE